MQYPHFFYILVLSWHTMVIYLIHIAISDVTPFKPLFSWDQYGDSDDKSQHFYPFLKCFSRFHGINGSDFYPDQSSSFVS
jgi:hypothetical protein